LDKLDRKLLGKKILKLRKRKQLTQKELGILSGLSESGIRSYELGNRNPKEPHLEKIAQALGVNPEALKDFGIITDAHAIQALFRLQEQGRFEPRIVESRSYLASAAGNSAMFGFLRDWAEKYAELQDDKITEEEYEEWKDSYSLYTRMN
jgi:transcriptional regulator with XRE-family HTH domain